MKKSISVLVLVALVFVVISCGGGGGTDADSAALDPTGTEWQFLVTAAGAGDSMYTLTFFDPQGLKGASGLFTAVSGSGATYDGTWSVSGSVVTGTSSAGFSFTLTVNTDSATGTIDYVTAEGSGTAAATKTGSTAAPCSQYAGNWSGTGSGTDCSGAAFTKSLTMTVGDDCSATVCNPQGCLSTQVVGDSVSFSITTANCGSYSWSGSFSSATSFSGTWQYDNYSQNGTFSFTKQ